MSAAAEMLWRVRFMGHQVGHIGCRVNSYPYTCKARVFDGKTGTVRFSIDNDSGTATNYPTIADLKGDGRAEFILVIDS